MQEFKIKNRFNIGDIIEGEADSFIEFVEENKSNLKGAILKGAYLEGADLKGAILEGADLKGAILRWANLKGANLKGANLEGANLEGAKINNNQKDDLLKTLGIKIKGSI